MKSFKKIALVLLSLLIMVTGCDDKKSSDSPLAKTEKLKKKFTLSAEKNLSKDGINALEVFCEKVDELSDGKLKVEYTLSEDALEDFYNGTDLIFASNDVISRANADFLSYTSPFYFKDYDSAMITLNGKKFWNLTGDVTQSLLNAKPLGCFYDGSYTFISTKIDNLNTVNTFNEVRIYGDFSYNDEFLLESMGIKTMNTKIEAAEKFNSKNCHTMLIKRDELSNIEIPYGRENIYLYDNFFKCQFNWLFISDNIEKDLDEYTSAVFAEAAASAKYANDVGLLKRENAGLEHLKDLNANQIKFDNEALYEYALHLYETDRKFKYSWDLDNHKAVRALINPR